ncbi:trichohyalin-like isoform X2 [Girardinichthys multiradiatus]|uniref:trichohyalin-like isoform X2 n=1 Tax=Girardinichthys multiradiatus TaxID=208333 RepID=UPI001FAC5528|nr:trichohyalin-like isoform X2 [Girardinichthys multiradiatus]
MEEKKQFLSQVGEDAKQLWEDRQRGRSRIKYLKGKARPDMQRVTFEPEEIIEMLHMIKEDTLHCRKHFIEEKTQIKWMSFQTDKRRKKLDQKLEKMIKESIQLEILKLKMDQQRQETEKKWKEIITLILTTEKVQTNIEKSAEEVKNTNEEMLKTQKIIRKSNEETKAYMDHLAHIKKQMNRWILAQPPVTSERQKEKHGDTQREARSEIVTDKAKKTTTEKNPLENIKTLKGYLIEKNTEIHGKILIHTNPKKACIKEIPAVDKQIYKLKEQEEILNMQIKTNIKKLQDKSQKQMEDQTKSSTVEQKRNTKTLVVVKQKSKEDPQALAEETDVCSDGKYLQQADLKRLRAEIYQTQKILKMIKPDIGCQSGKLNMTIDLENNDNEIKGLLQDMRHFQRLLKLAKPYVELKKMNLDEDTCICKSTMNKKRRELDHRLEKVLRERDELEILKIQIQRKSEGTQQQLENMLKCQNNIDKIAGNAKEKSKVLLYQIKETGVKIGKLEDMNRKIEALKENWKKIYLLTSQHQAEIKKLKTELGHKMEEGIRDRKIFDKLESSERDRSLKDSVATQAEETIGEMFIITSLQEKLIEKRKLTINEFDDTNSDREEQNLELSEKVKQEILGKMLAQDTGAEGQNAKVPQLKTVGQRNMLGQPNERQKKCMTECQDRIKWTNREIQEMEVLNSELEIKRKENKAILKQIMKKGEKNIRMMNKITEGKRSFKREVQRKRKELDQRVENIRREKDALEILRLKLKQPKEVQFHENQTTRDHSPAVSVSIESETQILEKRGWRNPEAYCVMENTTKGKKTVKKAVTELVPKVEDANSCLAEINKEKTKLRDLAVSVQRKHERLQDVINMIDFKQQDRQRKDQIFHRQTQELQSKMIKIQKEKEEIELLMMTAKNMKEWIKAAMASFHKEREQVDYVRIDKRGEEMMSTENIEPERQRSELKTTENIDLEKSQISERSKGKSQHLKGKLSECMKVNMDQLKQSIEGVEKLCVVLGQKLVSLNEQKENVAGYKEVLEREKDILNTLLYDTLKQREQMENQWNQMIKSEKQKVITIEAVLKKEKQDLDIEKQKMVKDKLDLQMIGYNLQKQTEIIQEDKQLIKEQRKELESTRVELHKKTEETNNLFDVINKEKSKLQDLNLRLKTQGDKLKVLINVITLKPQERESKGREFHTQIQHLELSRKKLEKKIEELEVLMKNTDTMKEKVKVFMRSICKDKEQMISKKMDVEKDREQLSNEKECLQREMSEFTMRKNELSQMVDLDKAEQERIHISKTDLYQKVEVDPIHVVQIHNEIVSALIQRFTFLNLMTIEVFQKNIDRLDRKCEELAHFICSFQTNSELHLDRCWMSRHLKYLQGQRQQLTPSLCEMATQTVGLCDQKVEKEKQNVSPFKVIKSEIAAQKPHDLFKATETGYQLISTEDEDHLQSCSKYAISNREWPVLKLKKVIDVQRKQSLTTSRVSTKAEEFTKWRKSNLLQTFWKYNRMKHKEINLMKQKGEEIRNNLDRKLKEIFNFDKITLSLKEKTLIDNSLQGKGMESSTQSRYDAITAKIKYVELQQVKLNMLSKTERLHLKEKVSKTYVSGEKFSQTSQKDTIPAKMQEMQTSFKITNEQDEAIGEENETVPVESSRLLCLLQHYCCRCCCHCCTCRKQVCPNKNGNMHK